MPSHTRILFFFLLLLLLLLLHLTAAAAAAAAAVEVGAIVSVSGADVYRFACFMLEDTQLHAPIKKEATQEMST
jgi:hypothetical protein